MLTAWYIRQEALLGPTTGLGRVLAAKVASDELVLAPVFNAAYLGFTAAAEGRPARAAVEDNIWDVMLHDWAVWPAAMTICFLKVPVRARPMYVAFVGAAWNIFLSSRAHAGKSDVLPISPELNRRLSALPRRMSTKRRGRRDGKSPKGNMPMQDLVRG
jgi:hypothetical protein